MDKTAVHRLAGKTVELLSQALNFRSANHHVISGNIANIDTPGYKPRELSFDKELERAVGKNDISLNRTNVKHFSYYTGRFDQGSPQFEMRPMERPLTGSSRLNIEREMARMSQNNLLYEASAGLLSKKFEALKTAIESGRS
ncbi:MAG: flagellar basal body rod protein FlgB [Desulfatiglandales bacterium]